MARANPSAFSVSEKHALDHIVDALTGLGIGAGSGVQQGDETNQGWFNIALNDAASNTLDALNGDADKIGEVQIINNTSLAVWLQFEATGDKLEILGERTFTFPYAKLSDITIGNDSGTAIAETDPPDGATPNLICYWRGVTPS